MATETALTLSDIEAARQRIAGHARVTPVYPSETLTRLVGRDVFGVVPVVIIAVREVIISM